MNPSPLGESLLEWYIFKNLGKAVAVNEKNVGSCTCFVGEKGKACFGNKALGVLSEEQVAICAGIDERKMTEKIAQLMERYNKCGGEFVEWGLCTTKSPGS